MVLHIGTDEAGYGPLLGPLVVAGAVYETGAGRTTLPGTGIDDSKVVYGRGGRPALARALGPYLGLEAPVRLSGLLGRLSVRGDPRGGYAWYGDVEDDTGEAGSRPTEFRRLYVNPVCERDFNAGCAGDGGKASLLFRETMRVVRRALADTPAIDAEIICDKHGGRNRYAGLLMAEFSPSTLIPERESKACSSYRLTIGGRNVRIQFLAKADAVDVPAALASMAAKYVRELFMQGLNDFFAERVTGLRPTAGYYSDGRRFLEDVDRVLREMGCERTAFVRDR
jgi:ribonuclease HII